MTSPVFLDFERPIVDLELRLSRLRAIAEREPELAREIAPLEAQVERLQRETFSRLTRWQTVQLARHQQRPTALEHARALPTELVELQGDRFAADDPAIVGGPASIGGHSVMLIAHARGRAPDEELLRNYGMARPAGFRKVIRLVRLADRLGLPIVTLIDTPGAHPGADAEEHGQAWAIAGAIDAFAQARVPVVSCVVGEGGSGGALALAVADRLLMLEYAVFEVISPEACSSILFRDGAHAESMAEALHLTARDLLRLQLIDELIAEPPGGAHRDPNRATEALRDAVVRALTDLRTQPVEVLLCKRYDRVRQYGAVALQ
jgi:acetyl-CoA carboxylase carboxyl transferase subunit alpha